MKRTQKSRSNSALLFIRRIFIALGIFVLVYFAQCVLLNFLPILPQSISVRQLWYAPLFFSGLYLLLSFLSLARHGSLLVILTLAIVCSGLWMCNEQVYVLLKNSRSELFYQSQILRQKQSPLLEDSDLIMEEPVLMFCSGLDLENEWHSLQVRYIAEYISSLPEVLTQNAAAIYLMDEESFAQYHELEDWETTGVFGITTPGNLSIFVRVLDEPAPSQFIITHDGRQIFMDDPAFYGETIVHELVHTKDVYLSGGFELASSSDEFMALYEQYQYDLGSYGASQATEFFAEGGCFYFLYPDLLKQISLELYEYFQNLYSYY